MHHFFVEQFNENTRSRTEKLMLIVYLSRINLGKSLNLNFMKSTSGEVLCFPPQYKSIL